MKKKAKAKRKGGGFKKLQLPALPQTEGQAFIAMIERAARDPAIDTAKLKELLAIRNDEHERQAKQAFSAAMVRCQELMHPVRRDMQADRFKYASFAALDYALRPVYIEQGFGLTFDAQPIEGA